MNIGEIRGKIRPIALSIGFSAIGFLVAFVLKKFMHIDLSRLEVSVIAFVVTTSSVLLLFPGVFGIPFGKVSIGDFVRKVGLYKPKEMYKFVFLGMVAAFLTLTGMLLGSQATGKYVFDSMTITLTQAVFSLTPGIWEEVLFRGVIMIVLIRLTKSFRKAFIIQVVLFGLVHVKGLDVLSFVDAFSVGLLAIPLTLCAYKTNSLIPGIIFHYLHDTFLFTVQLPDGVYTGFRDNALFYCALWVSILVSVVAIKRVAERFHVSGEYDLYGLGEQDTGKTITETGHEEKKRSRSRTKRLLLVNAAGFLVVLLASFNESTLFIQIMIGIYILVSLILFFLFERIKQIIDFPANMLSAFVAFVTGYDYYSRGSEYAYMAWLLIGFIYILFAFVKNRRRRKVKEANYYADRKG
ncbi:MAG: CPBP family intramembrane metalloprotease [Acidobacteria bacterium]|nr:CPBP family intramembrane metalloprotease [Acidobacteriota bacterium]